MQILYKIHNAYVEMCEKRVSCRSFCTSKCFIPFECTHLTWSEYIQRGCNRFIWNLQIGTNYSERRNILHGNTAGYRSTGTIIMASIWLPWKILGEIIKRHQKRPIMAGNCRSRPRVRTFSACIPSATFPRPAAGSRGSGSKIAAATFQLGHFLSHRSFSACQADAKIEQIPFTRRCHVTSGTLVLLGN